MTSKILLWFIRKLYVNILDFAYSVLPLVYKGTYLIKKKKKLYS